MYIRRKVFSVLTDEMGEERLYSVNDTLFEGYEVDELDDRYFADHDAEITGAAKGAGVVGATAAGLAGGVYGTEALARAVKNSDRGYKLLKAQQQRAMKRYGEDKSKASLEAFKESVKRFEKASKPTKLGDKARQGAAVVEDAMISAKSLVKNNPKTAAAILAGTIAAGAGVGAAVGHHNKKNKK